jgi:hypothetical protein
VIEDIEQDVRPVYQQIARKGLEWLSDVKPHVAAEIETALISIG